MQVSTILSFIDAGHLALPEFQRGYVWNRDQVRDLMGSLYRRHPVGTLLVWATESKGAEYRGDGAIAPGVVKLILDGQQRITTLYGIIRGRPPRFFDGDEAAFTDLYFHLGSEEFAFYSPIKMRDDPLWIGVTRLMQDELAPFFQTLSGDPNGNEYVNRLNRVMGIRNVDLHIEEVAGEDKTIDVVVDIFNKVNSGGTTLSKGDLALAKICAGWPDARDAMKGHLARWREFGFHFSLDWLLRVVNTVLTGEARFNALHDVDSERFEDGLRRGVRCADDLLNLVSSRFGLDHQQVLFGRFAFPVMARWLDRQGGKLPEAAESDRLLYWYLHSALWGRYSASTETTIDRDLEVLASAGNDVEALLRELQLWRGELAIRPDHFGGWSLGARFYPMLYLMTRTTQSKDWGTGLELKKGLLGKHNRLEVHHIFPKSLLYRSGHGYTRSQVNAVANFAFLTRQSNLDIGNRPPEEYLPEIEERFPGALASQWIPIDRELWRIDRYLDFLESRKLLLARAANQIVDGLLHDRPLPEVPRGEVPEELIEAPEPEPVPLTLPGGIETEEEEAQLLRINDWLVAQGLPEGEFLFEIQDPDTAEPTAILDLAWPYGLQEGRSQPVTLLLDEGREALAAANAAGYRYFQSVEAFMNYIRDEIRPGMAAQDEAFTA
jgi:hypothetical protein